MYNKNEIMKIHEKVLNNNVFDEIVKRNVISNLNAPWVYKNILVNNCKKSRGEYFIPSEEEFDKILNEYFNNYTSYQNQTSSNKKTKTKPNNNTLIEDVPSCNRGYIPEVSKEFVSVEIYNNVKKVIESSFFCPVFISGLSGNGKTFSVEQACASLKREVYRVNITSETNEDDLIGGFRLLNGDMIWVNGPVIEAMENGAILLLDEIDLATEKIMCLQPILEGNPIYIKKIKRKVKPQSGFNIVATANTKGKGDDSGMFMGSNILNEAFLDRFSLYFSSEYPSVTLEKKILKNIFSKYNFEIDEKVENFIHNITMWASGIRKTYDEGGIDENITTRRVVSGALSYMMFDQNEKRVIELVTNKFDEITQKSFIELYDKIISDEEEISEVSECSEEEKL